MNNTQFHHYRYYFIIIDAVCEPIPPRLHVVPIVNENDTLKTSDKELLLCHF